jgi:hypothetical protein
MRAVPRLCEFYPGIWLTTEEKARKNFGQGKMTCCLCDVLLAVCYGAMMTHLTTIVLLYHHPADGRTTGRNMLVNIF